MLDRVCHTGGTISLVTEGGKGEETTYRADTIGRECKGAGKKDMFRFIRHKKRFSAKLIGGINRWNVAIIKLQNRIPK